MIKLNIQRFGHTNSTPNYELPQFVGTDKPQWLTDINQGFLAIDTAIHNAYALASLTSTNVGDITDLTTTVKTDVVSAVNEINGGLGNLSSTVASHTTAIGNNTTAIGNNTTAIGNLADLDTVDKQDLVGAINEVDLITTNNSAKIGNLTNLTTTVKTDVVSATNEVNAKINNFKLTDFDTCTVTGSSSTVNVTEVNVSCAKNSNGSLFKVYGNITLTAQAWDAGTTITISNTGLPTIAQADEYDIYGAVLEYKNEGTIVPKTLHYNSNGTLTVNSDGFGGSTIIRVYLPPCLYFNANFGDTPQ